MAKIVKKYFTGTTTWTIPSGVTELFIIASGGGGAGASSATGSTNYPGGGGGGALQVTGYITVVPNTTYTITIGAGGTAVTSGGGNDGIDTTFGSLFTAMGAGGAYGQNNAWCGGAVVRTTVPYSPYASSFFTGGYIPQVAQFSQMGGQGSRNVSSQIQAFNGMGSPQGFTGGGNGTDSSGYRGGGGGGGGSQGVGGGGGNGNASGVGGGGSSAAANTGAGGGGCGGGTTGTPTSGTGGSGYLYAIWVE